MAKSICMKCEFIEIIKNDPVYKEIWWNLSCTQGGEKKEFDYVLGKEITLPYPHCHDSNKKGNCTHFKQITSPKPHLGNPLESR